jgi:transcription elongation GreA/GreB family factor
MKKQILILEFIEQLQSDLVNMKEAARAAHEAATHEESKPENEYDTRGLEASYLAGAQAKRAAEIDEALALFKNTSFKEFDGEEAIQATALVEVQMERKNNWLLLMPKGGGVRVESQGQSVQIVTPQSSLGQALLGLQAGDEAEFEVGENVREFKVLSVM